jgi:drug/metabolite transporter (DMT)-like permease
VSFENIKALSPVALMHAIAHITAVISLGAGAVSFTHIVKAAEPAFTSFFSAVLLKQFFPLPVYLSLIPVMGGVALASLKERSFRWARAPACEHQAAAAEGWPLVCAAGWLSPQPTPPTPPRRCVASSPSRP